MSFDNRSSTREGNGRNSDVESQPPSLCKAGCGFYGNPSFEGLCSVCYKEKLKCQMQSMPAPTTRPISPPVASSSNDPAKEETAKSDTAVASMQPDTVSCSTSELPSTTSSVETGTTTVSGSTTADKPEITVTNKQPVDCDVQSSQATTSSESAVASVETASGKDTEPVSKEKPKKNRCLTCKKKVGLTGLQCRCNGLFCTTHRYSDMHDCPFDYKEMGQEQIRKNNPVVVGQKITKI